MDSKCSCLTRVCTWASNFGSCSKAIFFCSLFNFYRQIFFWGINMFRTCTFVFSLGWTYSGFLLKPLAFSLNFAISCMVHFCVTLQSCSRVGQWMGKRVDMGYGHDIKAGFHMYYWVGCTRRKSAGPVHFFNIFSTEGIQICLQKITHTLASTCPERKLLKYAGVSGILCPLKHW